MARVAPLTVYTASIPERAKMLARCISSVCVQSVQADGHIIYIHQRQLDLEPVEHCAWQQNRALAATGTEWVMRLADDDWLLPNHIETLEPYLTDEYDVVYSYDSGGSRPRLNVNDWSPGQVLEHLEHENFIDGSAAATRRALTAYPEHKVDGAFMGPHGEPLGFWDDWALFLSIARAGGRFRCVPEATWVYDAGPHPRISTGG